MTRPTALAWVAILPLLATVQEPKPVSAPEFLTFDELTTLSDTEHPSEPLAEKLERVLRTPVLSNQAALSGVRPHRPSVDGVGPVLRAVSWNIERGLNFDLIRLALSDPEGFKQSTRPSEVLDAKIDQQLRTLRDADIVVLNEVDSGLACNVGEPYAVLIWRYGARCQVERGAGRESQNQNYFKSHGW